MGMRSSASGHTRESLLERAFQEVVYDAAPRAIEQAACTCWSENPCERETGRRRHRPAGDEEQQFPQQLSMPAACAVQQRCDSRLVRGERVDNTSV